MITSSFLILFSLVFMYISMKMIMKATRPSVDHYTHLSFIKDIKRNRHRFLTRSSNVMEDRNFLYPQLMHFLLSFLPYSLSEKKYFRINFFIELSVYAFAVYTIVYFSNNDILKRIGFAAILLTTNPFGRFLWNAKVSGLSARNFGILTIYIYLFFFASSLMHNNIYLRIAGFCFLGFIVIISSQFATQFLLLFSIINLFFGNYLPGISLPLSFLLFFLLMPKVFLSYARGQYQHKKIWIRHVAKIDLLKKRYSVYRDFVYDFYKKKDLKYFFSNPLIEVLTGFPLIIVLLYIYPGVFISRPVIFSALACFFITSLRFSRFFGEPQRYVEMALPALVFIALKYLSVEQLYGVVAFNLIFFMLHLNTFANFSNSTLFSEEKINAIKQKINSDEQQPILAGNNWGMPGYFLPEKNMKIMLPTFTAWRQYGTTINKMFPHDLFSLDMNIAMDWIKTYKPNWFFLEAYYCSREKFEEMLTVGGVKYSFCDDLQPVLLYKLIHD